MKLRMKSSTHPEGVHAPGPVVVLELAVLPRHALVRAQDVLVASHAPLLLLLRPVRLGRLPPLDRPQPLQHLVNLAPLL